MDSSRAGSFPPLSRPRWASVLLLLAVAVAPFLAEAKSKKRGHHTTKGHWKKERECLKSTCKEIHEDENDDCLAMCVSEACHGEVYAAEPFEPGEVNKQRESSFNSCVKLEQEKERKAGKADGSGKHRR